MADQEDRTEAPSARRLEKAREEGQVAVSRDMQTLAGLGCATFALMMTGSVQFDRFVGGMRRMMENLASTDLDAGMLLAVHEALGDCARMAGPPVLAAAIGFVAVTLLQTGFLLRFAGLAPQLGRLSPAKGLKRIFGGDNLMETLKALVKLAAFVMAVRQLLVGLWPVLSGSIGWDATTLASRSAKLVLHGILTVLAVQAGIAILDVAWVRYRHTGKLRMSRQEVRDEHKESDGDPHVKGRLRQLRRQRSKRRMIDAVPSATVVITNPTHYSVALFYENGGKGAPKIVAKGVDELAARIREKAIDSKVPIVSNPPLARALYTVPLDSEIPREHFQAVAGIIAYVWRLRRPPPGPPPVR